MKEIYRLSEFERGDFFNKREIIRQLNQLPIQKQYELHLKNGKTKIVDKLTPLLIGKTQIMYFYETL
jgi:hypothetical protein